jgi:uncharacterized protein (DUF488 family)
MSDPAPTTLLTIGHSSRPLADTLALMRTHGVEHVVDVRRFPRSARHPHYDGPALAAALAAVGIDYTHAEALGGYREPRPDSDNTGLGEPAFRGYADHMESAVFPAAVDRLLALARERRVAFLCAEAKPAHCHRSLLSDALVARGARVEHVLDEGPREPHTLTRAARVADGRVRYPGPPEQLSIDGL